MNSPNLASHRQSTVFVDEVGVRERAARFQTRSIKKQSKVMALETVLSMIDLTTLEGADSVGKVRELCAKARNLQSLQGTEGEERRALPNVAAVCVYPTLVAEAKRCLVGTQVQVAAVATAFPSGQAPLEAKLADTKAAVSAGADEIDMVISRGRFHSGDEGFVFDEIATIKEACGKAHLKVILETGELGSFDRIRRASDLAMSAGADFIKTSTGKIPAAASLPVTLVMLEAIRDHYYATGQRIGMKPAGGISTAKLAIQYLIMLRETLGQGWMTPNLFRFGASSLANDVLRQIEKQRSGAYQSFDYFSQA